MHKSIFMKLVKDQHRPGSIILLVLLHVLPALVLVILRLHHGLTFLIHTILFCFFCNTFGLSFHFVACILTIHIGISSPVTQVIQWPFLMLIGKYKTYPVHGCTITISTFFVFVL
ncbi:hypothetical protein J3Q64DRAFT_1765488 [Phycomyces blakesleeanus]|uniref:Uncharacterized protein n=1 Tax=Phycomyces blakesleeanus TaxID=4837 RepID=A0ABR3APD5_PHYBL